MPSSARVVGMIIGAVPSSAMVVVTVAVWVQPLLDPDTRVKVTSRFVPERSLAVSPSSFTCGTVIATAGVKWVVTAEYAAAKRGLPA